MSQRIRKDSHGICVIVGKGVFRPTHSNASAATDGDVLTDSAFFENDDVSCRLVPHSNLAQVTRDNATEHWFLHGAVKGMAMQPITSLAWDPLKGRHRLGKLATKGAPVPKGAVRARKAAPARPATAELVG